MRIPRYQRLPGLDRSTVGMVATLLLVGNVSLIQPHPSLAKDDNTTRQAKPLTGTALQLSQELIHVARLAQQSVVNITSIGRVVNTHPSEPTPLFDLPFFKRFFGENTPPQEELPLPDGREDGMASGVIIRADGYILTNNHVVEQADNIRVLLADQREIDATVVGSDPPTDLAVIKIDATGLPTLSWGESTALQTGEVVLAVGNPFGLNQTVTMGIISAVGRANIGIIDYEDFIQTDAAINPGNSGGGLLNLQGELIGINTAIFSEMGGTVGIGFAIPSQIAQRVAQLLITQGRVIRGWIGVSTQKLTPDLSKHFRVPDTKGVVITEVAPKGPAARANLQIRDVVRTFNETPITEPRQLRSLIAETKPGTSIKITMLRSGHEKKVDVTIREFPHEPKPPMRDELETVEDELLGGVLLEDVPKVLHQENKGILVGDVTPGSIADMKGLEAGDIILEINDTAVQSVKDFERVKRIIKPNASVLLLVRRGKTSIFISIRSDE